MVTVPIYHTAWETLIPIAMEKFSSTEPDSII